MNNREFRLVLDGNFDEVLDIFEKPNISEAFEKTFKEKEKEIEFKMNVYEDYLNAISVYNNSITGVLIRDSFLLNFQEHLKARILFEAITRIFRYGILDIEESIIEIINTDSIDELIDDAFEDAFQSFVNLPSELYLPETKMMS